MPDITTPGLGLYIHIPFCKKKCPYCAFYKEIWKPSYEESFVEALCNDLKSYTVFKPTFSTIFFGGGTPTILSDTSFKKIIATIHQVGHVTTNCELTIEANPETISTRLLDTLSSCGVNRISIGIQSFNQNELDFLGRWHTTDTIEQALYCIRSHQKNWNLNIDLIFSLPNTTDAQLQTSLEKALTYAPQHLSTYGLTIEPDTLFEKKKVTSLPDEKELKQFEHIIQTCQKHHYDHYEVSAFAKPGFQCQHNLIYWTYNEFIGIGPSASSLYQSHRFSQPSDIQAYLQDPFSPFIKNQTQPLSQNDQMVEFIIAQLRLDQGLNKKDFSSRFGKNFEHHFEKPLTLLYKKNLLENTSTHIKKTTQGLYLLNEILIAFM